MKPKTELSTKDVILRVPNLSYRQLDYWARTSLLRPSILEANGSGTDRRYSLNDALIARLIVRLLGSGVSLQVIRRNIDALRAAVEAGVPDNAVIVITDGIRIVPAGQLASIVATSTPVIVVALPDMGDD